MHTSCTFKIRAAQFPSKPYQTGGRKKLVITTKILVRYRNLWTLTFASKYTTFSSTAERGGEVNGEAEGLSPALDSSGSATDLAIDASVTATHASDFRPEVIRQTTRSPAQNLMYPGAQISEATGTLMLHSLAAKHGLTQEYMFVCLGYGWVGYFTFLFFLISLS